MLVETMVDPSLQPPVRFVPRRSEATVEVETPGGAKVYEVRQVEWV
jgi:hypothetical protein